MIRYEDEVLIDYAWITVEKLSFKILVMASVLAMDNKAFLGTINDITRYLGLVNNRKNRANIKKALSELSRQGFIIQVNDKDNIIIALSYDAKNNSKVISIQRAWIQIIRDYKPAKNDSVSWETILRVFIYLIDNCGKSAIPYIAIANELSISEATVKKAVKAICNIDFGNIKIDKERLVDKSVINGSTFYHCSGNRYSVMINFEGLVLDDTDLG